jgi:hypothetical protein
MEATGWIRFHKGKLSMGGKIRKTRVIKLGQGRAHVKPGTVTQAELDTLADNEKKEGTV